MVPDRDGLRASELAEQTRQVNERLIVAGIRLAELVDEAEATRKRLALIAEVGRLLGASFDLRAVLPEVAGLLARELGDACTIEVADRSGAAWCSVFAPGGTAPAPDAFASVLSLSLESRTPARGTLTLLARARRYDAADAQLAADLTERIGFAVERAELHQQALDAVRARDDLLAAVSHDLRNPLNVIVLSASMLSKQAAGEGTRQSGPAERIRRSAEHMELLIADLVDSVKMGAGRFIVERRPEPLEPVVTQVCEMLAVVSESRSQRLEVDLDASLAGTVVWMDKNRIARVLGNLLGNAIKFTPPGGSIVVRAARKGAEVELSIHDTGPGIAPEHRARLFDRFWQARQTTQVGSGLGLFIAREIADAHGGRIWVESEVGAGSTFFVALPLGAPEPPPLTG